MVYRWNFDAASTKQKQSVLNLNGFGRHNKRIKQLKRTTCINRPSNSRTNECNKGSAFFSVARLIDFYKQANYLCMEFRSNMRCECSQACRIARISNKFNGDCRWMIRQKKKCTKKKNVVSAMSEQIALSADFISIRWSRNPEATFYLMLSSFNLPNFVCLSPKTKGNPNRCKQIYQTDQMLHECHRIKRKTDLKWCKTEWMRRRYYHCKCERIFWRSIQALCPIVECKFRISV